MFSLLHFLVDSFIDLLVILLVFLARFARSADMVLVRGIAFKLMCVEFMV